MLHRKMPVNYFTVIVGHPLRRTAVLSINRGIE